MLPVKICLVCFRNNRHRCLACGGGFQTPKLLNAHKRTASSHPCRECNQHFCHETRLRQHMATNHRGGGQGVSAPIEPAGLDEPIVGRTPYQDFGEYEDLLFEHRGVIRSQETNRSNWRLVNREIPPEFSYRDLKALLSQVMNFERHAFKINIAFSIVLYNTVERIFKFYYASHNSLLFDKAFTISTRHDMEKFFEKIKDLNLSQRFFYQRPASSWVLASVTNIQIKIYRLQGVPIGTPAIELPDHVKRSHSVISLTHQRNDLTRPYKDQKCLLRCLALHFKAPRGLETVANDLKRQLEDFTDKNFDDGVPLDDLPLVEDCFDVAINVYSLQEDKSAKVIRLTEKSTDNIVHLNLHERHFSYIKKFKSYAGKYQCLECNTFIKHVESLPKHKNGCKGGKVKEVLLVGNTESQKLSFNF